MWCTKLVIHEVDILVIKHQNREIARFVQCSGSPSIEYIAHFDTPTLPYHIFLAASMTCSDRLQARGQRRGRILHCYLWRPHNMAMLRRGSAGIHRGEEAQPEQ